MKKLSLTQVAKQIVKLYGPSGGKTKKTILKERIKTKRKP